MLRAVAASFVGAASGVSAADIEEVVVTAQKRDQALSNLGMTVSVLSADQFESRHIQTIEDVTTITPGLSFTKSNTTAQVYTLRGVGFYENGLNAYPTVTVYLDEAPLPFSAMTSHTGFDLERLEVLKGPQGTLFGANATGGALNFIAAKPTDTFKAGANLGYGRFDEASVEGYISGPLTQTLRARFSLDSVNAHEWQRDYTTGAQTGKTDVKAARLILDWRPITGFRSQFTLNAWEDKSDPQAAQLYRFVPQQVPTPFIPLSTMPPTPEDPRAAGFTTHLCRDSISVCNSGPFADNRLVQGALRFDYDATGAVTLTSLSAYATYKQNMALDRDGTSYRNFDLPYVKGDIHSFYQELRVANSHEQGTRWVGGVNYSKDSVTENYTMDWPDSTTRVAFDPPFLGRSGYRTDQKMKNWAVFGNIEHDLADLTLKAGARYTKAQRFAAGCNYDVPGAGIAAFFTGLSQITRTVLGLPASPLSVVQPGACSLIDTVGIEGKPPTGLPLEDRRDLRESNVSWRTGIDWRAAKAVLLYGNIAKGYKAGSIPGAPSTFNEQMLPVVQESVLAYEAGVKSTIFERRLQANAAVFYYDYKDKQLRSRYVNRVFGLLDKLVNVPKSSIKGAELELVYRPLSGLMLYSNYVYLDAKIDEFVGVSAEGVRGDFSGSRMPYAPKQQIAVGAEYEWGAFGSMSAFLGADYNYRSSTTAIIAGSAVYDIGSYGLLDLRAGVRGDASKWSLTLWGKNVANKYYWNNVAGVFDTVTRYAGRPATYGVSFAYKFD